MGVTFQIESVYQATCVLYPLKNDLLAKNLIVFSKKANFLYFASGMGDGNHALMHEPLQ